MIGNMTYVWRNMSRIFNKKIGWLPVVNKTSNQVSLQNLTPALGRWGVQYKKIECNFKKAVLQLWLCNDDRQSQYTQLAYNNTTCRDTLWHISKSLRLEYKSGWFIWIFSIEYAIALRITKSMTHKWYCWIAG